MSGNIQCHLGFCKNFIMMMINDNIFEICFLVVVWFVPFDVSVILISPFSKNYPSSQWVEMLLGKNCVIDNLNLSPIVVGLNVEFFKFVHIWIEWFIQYLNSNNGILVIRGIFPSTIFLEHLLQHLIRMVDIFGFILPSRIPKISQTRIVKSILCIGAPCKSIMTFKSFACDHSITLSR